MIRLRMTNTKPIIWLFGDESANDLRDDLMSLRDINIDVRCYAYTGATLESVMDAQLLMAIGSGTSPAAIIVAAGAYDALLIAMGGRDTRDASAQIAMRVQRLKTILRLRTLDSIPLLVHLSLQNEPHCTKLGIPFGWAEQVRMLAYDEPAGATSVSGTLKTLLVGLGFGKDSGHESS
jgi:hypothetical protein